MITEFDRGQLEIQDDDLFGTYGHGTEFGASLWLENAIRLAGTSPCIEEPVV